MLAMFRCVTKPLGRDSLPKAKYPHLYLDTTSAPTRPVTIIIQSTRITHKIVGHGIPAVNNKSIKSNGVVINQSIYLT